MSVNSVRSLIAKRTSPPSIGLLPLDREHKELLLQISQLRSKLVEEQARAGQLQTQLIHAKESVQELSKARAKIEKLQKENAGLAGLNQQLLQLEKDQQQLRSRLQQQKERSLKAEAQLNSYKFLYQDYEKRMQQLTANVKKLYNFAVLYQSIEHHQYRVVACAQFDSMFKRLRECETKLMKSEVAAEVLGKEVGRLRTEGRREQGKQETGLFSSNSVAWQIVQTKRQLDSECGVVSSEWQYRGFLQKYRELEEAVERLK